MAIYLCGAQRYDSHERKARARKESNEVQPMIMSQRNQTHLLSEYPLHQSATVVRGYHHTGLYHQALARPILVTQLSTFRVTLVNLQSNPAVNLQKCSSHVF